MLSEAATSAALVLAIPTNAAPPPTVMLVEMGRYTGDGGLYVPPDAEPDFLPYYAYLRAFVRPVRTFSGRHHRRPIHLEFIGHAAFVPGVVMFVIAEPNRRAPGLFARWYTHVQDARGRYCVPETVVAELRVQRALQRATQVYSDGQALRCISSNLVTRDH